MNEMVQITQNIITFTTSKVTFLRNVVYLCVCLTEGGAELRTHRAERHTADRMMCTLQLHHHTICRVVQTSGCFYLCFRM